MTFIVILFKSVFHLLTAMDESYKLSCSHGGASIEKRLFAVKSYLNEKNNQKQNHSQYHQNPFLFYFFLPVFFKILFIHRSKPPLLK